MGYQFFGAPLSTTYVDVHDPPTLNGCKLQLQSLTWKSQRSFPAGGRSTSASASTGILESASVPQATLLLQQPLPERPLLAWRFWVVSCWGLQKLTPPKSHIQVEFLQPPCCTNRDVTGPSLAQIVLGPSHRCTHRRHFDYFANGTSLPSLSLYVSRNNTLCLPHSLLLLSHSPHTLGCIPPHPLRNGGFPQWYVMWGPPPSPPPLHARLLRQCVLDIPCSPSIALCSTFCTFDAATHPLIPHLHSDSHTTGFFRGILSTQTLPPLACLCTVLRT